MTAPLTDLYLRDCRERLESSEHMDPIEWAERTPSLLGEIERLRAEVARLTMEERKWRHAGADGIDALADLLGKAQSEIERLTGERDAWIDAAARTSETLSIEAQESEATIRSLRADLGHVEPAEEPRVRVAGVGWICEVCCGPVEHNAEVAVWSEPHRTVVAHAGACPAPDLWLIEYRTPSSNVRYKVLSAGGPGGNLARPYEEALPMARYWAALPHVRLVRLVRCKEPRRG